MQWVSLSTTHSIAAALLLASAAGSARAITPDLDFGVNGQASYQALCDAIRACEHVRYDYVNDPNPRVVGAATALIAFASQNPLADESKLTDFVDAYDTMLAGHAASDPNLDRSSNLLTGLRFTAVDSTGSLAGTNTEVGRDVIGLLGIDVPESDNYDSMKRRMVRFDRARIRSFSNSSEWMQMLVIGFSGQDLHGAPNAHLAGVLRTYLEALGFEPVPDGSPDDARFADVESALAASLPVSYTNYANRLAQPIETSVLWSAVRGAFDEVAARTDDRIAEFHAEMADEPTLIEGLANANDPGIMDQLVAEYRSRIDEVAAPRTIVASNALFLLQSTDPSVRNLAQQSLDFSDSQLETNSTMAGITSGVQYASGLATLGLGIATGNPANAIGGLTSSVLGGIGLVDAFGGVSPPSAEEQIFGEITEMRDQLEDVRAEMNMRFNRIEDQLDVMYDSMATGFNALGAQIGDLNADVEDLSREMMIARASLERIEDALWGMSSDILDSFIADDANQYLDYRDDNGVDLPYTGATSFIDAINGFFTVATFHARDTETFAGDFVSTLTVANADQVLNGESIGRNINDLRVFPAQLGLPVLWNSRVAAAGPWSQAAGAYTQIARENPWYFAYKYERELTGGGTPPELDVIIGLGESLTAAAGNARSTELFDALFDGYDGAVDDILARLDTVRFNVLNSVWLPFIDPWASVWQNVQQNAVSFTTLDGQLGLDDLPLPAGTGSNCWQIFGATNVPEIASVLVQSEARVLGVTSTEAHEAYVNAGGPNANDFGMIFRFSTVLNTNPPQHRVAASRNIRFNMYSFGDPVNINSDSQAMDLFDEDFFFWTQLRTYLITGENLENQSIHLVNGNNEQIRLDVVFDFDADQPYVGPDYIAQRLDGLQDEVWQAAASDPIIAGLSLLLPAYESLIEAY
ncbi:MAG: hypothetical protein K8E66_09290, partial [Phycisphaerales bacterium]|nr:hypothetical protein [Phycisphaerales bacterium]